jgi:hypothetical protein
MPNLSTPVIVILILACLSLAGSTWSEHQKLLVSRAEHTTYVTKAEKLASDQRAKIAQLEKDNAEKEHAAELARIAFSDELRRNRELARTNRMSVTPATQAGSDRLCFSRTAFDAALQQFLGEIEGFVAEGDSTLGNARFLLASWPKGISN